MVLASVAVLVLRSTSLLPLEQPCSPPETGCQFLAGICCPHVVKCDLIFLVQVPTVPL